MKPELYEEVVITQNFPQQNLQIGDVVTLVDYIPHPQGKEEGAIVEIFNALGESIGVATVPLSAIAPLRAEHMPSVRPLTATLAPESPDLIQQLLDDPIQQPDFEPFSRDESHRRK